MARDSMELKDIAAEISLAELDEVLEPRLCGWFNNMLVGLRYGHVELDAAKRRLRELIASYERQAVRNRATLENAFSEAVHGFGELDHYERPQALDKWLDRNAVTIQGDCGRTCGQYWLTSRQPASAKVIARAFSNGGCDGWVGQENKPIWITPYDGEIRSLCEEAGDPDLPGRRRAELTSRIVAMLGIEFNAGEGLLAFVTKATIDELVFNHPITSVATKPKGPTILEARTHGRFRPWPRDASNDAYGRTYDRDARSRKGTYPTGHHGVAEATRPRLAMSEFSRCIFLGVVGADTYDDKDDDYLEAIGSGGRSVADLLNDLAGVTGL
jgi:hypothetical protein